MRTITSSYRPIVKTLLAWWVVLTIVAVASLYLLSPALPTLRSSWGLVGATAGRLSLVFPFVAYVGGIVGSAGKVGYRTTAVVGLVTVTLGALAYSAGAILAPVSEWRADRAVGLDVRSRHPTGAPTPTGLARLRTMVRQTPPPEYSFSVERPTTHPPNWLTHLIHQPIALAAFGILNAVLGLLLGWTTSGLSPPRRRHVRWLLGLVSAAAFLALAMIASSWVRDSPGHSGVLGAWVPLALPLLEIMLAYATLRAAQGRDLHAGPSSSI